MSTSDDEEQESHESYGMVGFSRCQGNPGRLFGSSLKKHESFVRLRISRAVRIHSLSHDRYYSSAMGDIVEVDLSSAQFAELLTTMNMSSGVPCTIKYIDGHRVEGPPETKEELERIHAGFQRDMNDLSSRLHSLRKSTGEILDKKNLSRSDRKDVLDRIDMIVQHIEHNIPFVLDQFEEATEKVVQQAKSEIDSFVTSSLITKGMAQFERELVNKTGQVSVEKLLAEDESVDTGPGRQDPKPGEKIYVESSSFDDGNKWRGMATIKSVRKGVSGGKTAWFVNLVEIPGNFNYDVLLEKQKKTDHGEGVDDEAGY